MLERTWVNSGLLRILGVNINAKGDPFVQEQERLFAIGILIGNMMGMPLQDRERWIKEKVGIKFLGFPNGLTDEDCEAIYWFSIDSRGFWEI